MAKTDQQQQALMKSIKAAYEGREKARAIAVEIRKAGFAHPEKLQAQEIARFWRVTVPAVSGWHSKAGCPRNNDGTYNLADVIAWREATIRAIPTGEKAAKERKLEAEARKKEIEVAELEGQMVPLAEIQQERLARIHAVKQTLMTVPNAVAPMLTGLSEFEATALLREKMREVLCQFSGQSYAPMGRAGEVEQEEVEAFGDETAAEELGEEELSGVMD